MISITATSTRFHLGQVVTTANALSILTPEEMSQGLARHAKCDWGNVCQDSVEQNNQALQDGSRILSAYGEGRRRFWIITEADRSATTILMPEDY